MRYINVNNCDTEISDYKADKLIESGALYECGPEYGHDLHLNPEHKFHVGEVEILMSPEE